HVERPRHLRGRDGAREAEAQRVAVPLGIAARELHTIPVDRPGQIARDEVALMRAFEAIADLPEMQRVRGRARDVVDADVPLAADVDARRLGGRPPGPPPPPRAAPPAPN